MTFAASLRDEVNLTTVGSDFETTVRDAIAPTSSYLWLRSKEPR